MWKTIDNLKKTRRTLRILATIPIGIYGRISKNQNGENLKTDDEIYFGIEFETRSKLTTRKFFRGKRERSK
jgi:hypothetical protein